MKKTKKWKNYYNINDISALLNIKMLNVTTVLQEKTKNSKKRKKKNTDVKTKKMEEEKQGITKNEKEK